MTFLYTSRAVFDKLHQGDKMSWDKYIEWSRLTHLTELVSLDAMLNESLVEPDHDNSEDWDYIHVDGLFETGFFTTPAYVLSKTKIEGGFNFLTVVINPGEECKDIKLDDYEFLGYDLLDKEYGNSALTNCGGFDETFLPADLNSFGLIEDYERAFDIRNRLIENNPLEHHADTNLIAVWRHKTIGK